MNFNLLYYTFFPLDYSKTTAYFEFKTRFKAILISFIKFFTKCGHPTDDNKKDFFHWELDQSETDKKVDESEEQEPTPNPMQEKDSIINIRAKEKLLQRTSLQQTLLNIVGYIMNVIALTIIALQMYPGELNRQNTKYLIDQNLRWGFNGKTVGTRIFKF